MKPTRLAEEKQKKKKQQTKIFKRNAEHSNENKQRNATRTDIFLGGAGAVNASSVQV